MKPDQQPHLPQQRLPESPHDTLAETAASGSTAAFPWVTVLVIGLCLGLAYAPVLKLLVRDWIIDENVSHGFLVPLVSGYIVWRRRHELARLPVRRSRLGLVVMAWAAAQLYVAVLGAELFLARTAFLLSLGGALLYLGGWSLIRALAFPLLLLMFMIPLPAILYNQITFPLQLLASRMAEATLSLLAIPVLREGNILELPNQRLSVVEACSGIRSLLSLGFLALVYGYFLERRGWVRVTLFVLTVPIAVFANSLRVSITGLLTQVNPQLAEGFFHFAEGLVIFLSALVLLVLAHRLLQLLIRVTT